MNNSESQLRKRSYIFALNIIRFLGSLQNKDITIHIIKNQLLRSGTSIGANIVEAQAGSSRRDFTNYLNHSLKSANESEFWLGLLKDTGKVNRAKSDYLIKEVIEIANMLGSSLLTLKGKKF